MKTISKFALLFLAGLLSITSGCRTSVTVTRPAVYSAASLELQAGLSPEEQRDVDANCIFGLPKLNNGAGSTDFIARKGYVLVHSAVDKIPVFVCEHVTSAQIAGNLSRDDVFRVDPLLKPGRRAEMIDYSKSGFDRGHQAPAGDQTTDAQLKAETFFLSNMAPQVPAFNRQIWKELETTVRGWAKTHKEVYIITGGMFFDPKEDNKNTANGLVTHKVIGPDGVAVPSHFYKIVVAKDGHGDWQAIGFVLENKKFPTPARGQHYDFQQFIKPVRWIEQHTGINFMPDLDAAESKRLEGSVSAIWN